MGRYMRKTKSGESAVMELSSQQSTIGVRTRAKTLALQRLQSDSSSYLELRSRRLEKPKELCRESPKSKSVKSSPSLNGEEAEASFGENFLDFDPARWDFSLVILGFGRFLEMGFPYFVDLWRKFLSSLEL